MSDRKINSDSANAQMNLHLSAYNAAFYELGLRWHWDSQDYQTLLREADEKQRVRIYLELHQRHLLTAYDADFLSNAIQVTKSRCYDRLAAQDPKVGTYTNWAEIQMAQIGA